MRDSKWNIGSVDGEGSIVLAKVAVISDVSMRDRVCVLCVTECECVRVCLCVNARASVSVCICACMCAKRGLECVHVCAVVRTSVCVIQSSCFNRFIIAPEKVASEKECRQQSTCTRGAVTEETYIYI